MASYFASADEALEDDIWKDINHLGGWTAENEEQKIYVCEPDADDCLKGLVSYLKKDDPQELRAVRMMCQWKLIEEHLIPIWVYYRT